MRLGAPGSFGKKALAWAVALGLAVVLLGLLVATGESIRHADLTAPLPEAAERDQPSTQEAVDNTYHDPALAGWMTQ